MVGATPDADSVSMYGTHRRHEGVSVTTARLNASMILLFGTLVGCATGDEPGHYFDVAVNTDRDECNEPDVSYKEAFRYRLALDGSSATIFIDGAPFAAGVLSGCDLVYDSILYTDERETGTVRWKVAGSAVVDIGNGCDAGAGWVGEERIDITESEDPEIERGCSFYTTVEGSYEGEVN